VPPRAAHQGTFTFQSCSRLPCSETLGIRILPECLRNPPRHLPDVAARPLRLPGFARCKSDPLWNRHTQTDEDAP